MIREIKNIETEEIYKRFCEDFPFEERYELTFTRFREQLEKWWEVFLYEEEKQDKAYCIGTQSKEYYLLVFFAVYEPYRGQGIGTKFIKEFKKTCKRKKGILIEVEDPAYAKNEQEKKTRERRISFYEKLGFYTIKKIQYELYETPYKIMLLDTKPNMEYSLEGIKQNLKIMYPFIKKEEDQKITIIGK